MYKVSIRLLCLVQEITVSLVSVVCLLGRAPEIPNAFIPAVISLTGGIWIASKLFEDNNTKVNTAEFYSYYSIHYIVNLLNTLGEGLHNMTNIFQTTSLYEFSWNIISLALDGLLKHRYHGPLTRYVKLRVAHAPAFSFPHHQFQRKPRVSNPGMHHGTCMTAIRQKAHYHQYSSTSGAETGISREN